MDTKIRRIASILLQHSQRYKDVKKVELIEEELQALSDIDIHYFLEEYVDEVPSLHRYLVFD